MPSTNPLDPEPIKLASIAKEILDEKLGEHTSTSRETKRHIIVVKDKEAILVEIDAKNVFAETKAKLVDATANSLKSLKACLEKEIKQYPNSHDAKEFKEMLRAINELLERRQ